MKTLFPFMIVTMLLCSCKKNHTCTCSTPNGNMDVFTVNDKRGQAKRLCKSYSAPSNSQSASKADCKLK